VPIVITQRQQINSSGKASLMFTVITASIEISLNQQRDARNLRNKAPLFTGQLIYARHYNDNKDTNIDTKYRQLNKLYACNPRGGG
jgi:hypothetical protein